MVNEIVLIVFYIIILLYSVILHEVSHGVMALWLGDPTAKYAGRLTFNPMKHIDFMGSIIVPLVMYFSMGFAFGWAKPVPYNPYNLKNQKWGPALVGLAGPASNILLATVSAIFAYFIFLPAVLKTDIASNALNPTVLSTLLSGSVSAIFFSLLMVIVIFNIILGFFNLIPIPPLDGSKLLFSIFPMKIETLAILEQYGVIFLLLFIAFFSGPLGIFLNFMLNIFLRIAI
jgi:Zn-dependent protease